MKTSIKIPTLLLFLVCMLMALVPPSLQAQFFDPLSSDADGAFNPTTNVEINLGEEGEFDEEHFAIVFNYTTIDIPEGVTVTFKNHPKNPPAIWLASGDVNIAGTVDLSGKPGTVAAGTDPAPGGEGGPGAFPGGAGTPAGWPGASDGLGPGGGGAGVIGNYWQHSPDPSVVGHGSFGKPGIGRVTNGMTYGTPLLVPFQIMGSGGGGGTNAPRAGGGGGGGLKIASKTQIVIQETGILRSLGGTAGGAIGGNGGSGSAGAFRLVAPVVSGNGTIDVGNVVAYGGTGIIRIDAVFKAGIAFTRPSDPVYTVGANMIVFPAEVPKVVVTKIGTTDIDPADLDPIIYDTTGEVTPSEVEIFVEVTGFPPDSTAYLTVRVTPEFETHIDHPLDIFLDSSGKGAGSVMAELPPGQLNRVDVWTRTPPAP